MIICSCEILSSSDIERAVAEIMLAPNALLPTPGIVFRQLQKRMKCCSCAPLAVEAIYAAMDKLQSDTRICPFALAEARAKLIRLEEIRARESGRSSRYAGACSGCSGRAPPCRDQEPVPVLAAAAGAFL